MQVYHTSGKSQRTDYVVYQRAILKFPYSTFDSIQISDSHHFRFFGLFPKSGSSHFLPGSSSRSTTDQVDKVNVQQKHLVHSCTFWIFQQLSSIAPKWRDNVNQIIIRCLYHCSDASLHEQLGSFPLQSFLETCVFNPHKVKLCSFSLKIQLSGRSTLQLIKLKGFSSSNLNIVAIDFLVRNIVELSFSNKLRCAKLQHVHWFKMKKNFSHRVCSNYGTFRKQCRYRIHWKHM